MSYYELPDNAWQVLPAGTPGWQFAPVPGWGMNPFRAGPPMLATEGLGRLREFRPRRGARLGSQNVRPYDPGTYGMIRKLTKARAGEQPKAIYWSVDPKTLKKRRDRSVENRSYGLPYEPYEGGLDGDVPARWTIADYAPVTGTGADSDEQATEGMIAFAAAGGIVAGWFLTWVYFSTRPKKRV